MEESQIFQFEEITCKNFVHIYFGNHFKYTSIAQVHQPKCFKLFINKGSYKYINK